MPGPQAGEPDMGLRTLTPVEELLQYNCSPVCGSLTQGDTGFDYIAGLHLLPVSRSSLCVWFQEVFFYRFQFFVFFFLIDGYSGNSCNFGVLMRGGEIRAFLLCQFGHSLPSHIILIRNHVP